MRFSGAGANLGSVTVAANFYSNNKVLTYTGSTFVATQGTNAAGQPVTVVTITLGSLPATLPNGEALTREHRAGPDGLDAVGRRDRRWGRRLRDDPGHRVGRERPGLLMDAGAGAGMRTRTDERDPGARVLVVEDDADVARPLVLTLREEGYAVTWAASGWQALELLRRVDRGAGRADPAGAARPRPARRGRARRLPAGPAAPASTARS